jgi:hypothetical protein
MATYQITLEDGSVHEIETEDTEPTNKINVGEIAKEATSYLNPFSKARESGVITDPEKQKETLGVVGRLAYEVPNQASLNMLTPALEKVGIDTPDSTNAEKLTAGLLPFGGAVNAVSKIPKVGKVASSVVAPALGYAYNPEDKKIASASDPRRFVGAAVGATGAIAGKVAEKVSGYIKPEAVDALKRGLKPGKNNTQFTNDAKLAIPKIKEAGVNVETVEDFVDASTKAKRKIWDELSAYTEAADKSGIRIDGKKLGESAENILDQFDDIFDKSGANKVRELANELKGINLGVKDAEDMLSKINSRLTSHYKKSARGMQVDLKDGEIAAMLAIRKTLRDELINSIEGTTGKNVSRLRKEYGALMNVQDEALGRVNVSGRQQPISLQEAINTVFGATRLASGDISGILQIGAGQVVKKLNSTNYLVKSAVNNYGKGKMPYSKAGKVIGISGSAMINRSKE